MNAVVSYRVIAPDPRNHLFHVSCTVAVPDPAGQEFALPGWIRGSYLVRDFAKHVVDVRASSGAVERLDKNRLRCAAAPGALTLGYRVHAFDASVRKAWLDLRRGFFNGSSLFYCPRGFERARFEVEILPPDHPACADWQLATTLTPLRTNARGFGLYAAADYEELIDHPVEMAAFQRVDFVADGVPHTLTLSGRVDVDGERLARDLKKICEVERGMFAQEPRLDRYLFMTHVTESGYGGLEHRSSTALTCARGDLPRPGDARLTKGYRGFLGLCAHEYFHLWNVKRITAQSFLDSNLQREAYTRDLWHYEGATSYYDDLFLLRAGILDAPAYLDLVAENATRHSRTPGRAVQTLSDSSFETWIKYYQPDENTPNAGVNYYIKGALAALCLDLTLRLHSRVTLDDVMRALWTRFGAEMRGVPEGGLEQVAQELSGVALGDFFNRVLRSTAELPLAELLAEFGVSAAPRAQINDSDAGGRVSGEPPSGYTGLRLKPGDTRAAYVLNGTPAEAAGLAANDQLVALDGLRLAPGNIVGRLASLMPGCAYELLYFRGDELQRGMLTPVAPPLDSWTLTLAEVDGEKLARRKAWLGS